MSSMPAITILVGALLSVYGVYSATSAEKFSVTALIPTFIGLGFIVLGVVARKDQWRKHAMHAAALLGLVGFLGGGAMGFKNLPRLLNGDLERAAQEDPEKKKDLNKARSQNILALVCLVFLGLCVNSFVQARRQRRQAESIDATQPAK